MDPKLLEILKKAKQIDKAAEKFDSSAIKRSTTPGMLGDRSMSSTLAMEGVSDVSMGLSDIAVNGVKQNVGTEQYKNAVQNSKLPAAIQKAMLDNPIPQPTTGFDVDINAIRELRGESVGPSYTEEDEIDFYEKPVRRSETQKKRVIQEESQTGSPKINEAYLRKLIASEISKALPKIIENYFDNRLVKENVQFKAGSTTFSGTVMPMPKIKGRE